MNKPLTQLALVHLLIALIGPASPMTAAAQLAITLTPAQGAGADAYTDSNNTTTAFGETDPGRLLIRRNNTKAYVRFDLSAHPDYARTGRIESAEIVIQQTGVPLRVGEVLELFAVNLNYNFANDSRSGIDWKVADLTHAMAPASGAGGSVSTAGSRSLLIGAMEQSADGVYYRYAEQADMASTPLLDYLNGISGFSRTDTPLRQFIIAEALDQARTTKIFASAQNTIGAMPPTLNMTAAQRRISYLEWTAGFGLEEGQNDPAANPIGDGLSNAIKYALGLSPLEHAPLPLLQLQLAEADGKQYFQLETHRNPQAQADVFFEISEDLEIWQTGTDHVSIIEQSGSRIIGRDKTPVKSTHSRFMRLRVGLQDPYKYTEKVALHLNTLMEYGRDVYGPVSTPLFVGVLSDLTLTAPNDPGYAPFPRSGHPPDERALGGANLWRQADLIRLLHRMSPQSPEYATAADAHITHYLDHLAVFSEHGQGGMLWWGNHLHYNVFTDEAVSLSKLENEINMGIHDPIFLWQRMWDLRPEAALSQTQLIWDWFIFDKDSGAWDRHGKNTPNWAVGFSVAGASFIRAFAVAFERTGNSVWKLRAEKLRDNMWNQRNPLTQLIPNAANASTERAGDLFWRRNFSSSQEPGHWSRALLYAYAAFGDPIWLQQAEDIISGFLQHAYDPAVGAFYKWIRLDGVYDPGHVDGTGNEYGSPESGHSAFWRDGSDYRVNSYIALACLDAYEHSGNPALLAGAEIIATELLNTEPRSDSNSGGFAVGAWAEHYASAIDILMRMHRFTGNVSYLERALYIADHAVSKLWNPVTEIFRGHFQHGYEIADGTDRLCEVLVMLNAYMFNQRPF
jgi:hypothetical protein